MQECGRGGPGQRTRADLATCCCAAGGIAAVAREAGEARPGAVQAARGHPARVKGQATVCAFSMSQGCASPVLTASNSTCDWCHGLHSGRPNPKRQGSPLICKVDSAQSSCLCRMEHFSPQTLDTLAEMPPARGKLILKNLQNRNWREVPDVSQAVWVAVNHFK